MHSNFLSFALGIVGLGMSFFFVRVMLAHPGWGPLLAVAGLFVTLLTLMQPRMGLYVLVFSMLLSPGFSAGAVGDRIIEVRLDDIFLVLVFVAWFTIATIRREAITGFNIPLIRGMFGYIAVAALSSLLGILREDLGWRSTFFYWLKYAQYFMLYYMALSVIKDVADAKKYLLAGLVTAVCVLAYAYREMAAGGRPYCPFDIHEGVKETATLGGYLAIVIGVAGGIALYHRVTAVKFAMVALIVACLPPLLSTGSRSTYLAVAGMFGGMVLLGKGRRIALVLAGIVGFYILPTVLGPYLDRAAERVAYTFESTAEDEQISFLGKTYTLEVSTATRLRQWRRMWNVWLPERPLIGHGVTGVGLVDSQIPRVIGETGILGFAFFGLIMYELFRRVLDLFRKLEDGFEKGLVFGFLCVFIGLLIQSIGVNTFIIIRMMEPFWFLVAVVMRIYILRMTTGPELVPGEAPRMRAPLPRLGTA